jgi:hypothetical protein
MEQPGESHDAANAAARYCAPPQLKSPLRVVINGNRLDIQASVNLEGIKKLRTMLEKYEGILQMMEPPDEAAE